MTLWNDKHECCGCAACAAVCPRGALMMVSDSEGFAYPKIDDARCTDCGLCRKACVFRKPPREGGVPAVYAAKHKNHGVRASSTSGGVFTALSDVILNRGGVIYGAAFDGQLRVRHRRADTPEGRDAFKGSKYVQSDTDGIYEQVGSDLAAERTVLYSGTPCQTAAMRHAMSGAKGGALLLCDLVCHGVPSPMIWEEHLRFLTQKRGARPADYAFRHKRPGIGGSVERAVYPDGTADCESLISQLQLRLFDRVLTFRPSCHTCPYTNLRRPSDITIADFWGLERSLPDFYDTRGVSLILVNTPAGQALLSEAAPALELRESDTAACTQPNLEAPTRPSPERERFWADFRRDGYEAALRRHTNYNAKGYLRWMLKRLIRKRHG